MKISTYLCQSIVFVSVAETSFYTTVHCCHQKIKFNYLTLTLTPVILRNLFYTGRKCKLHTDRHLSNRRAEPRERREKWWLKFYYNSRACTVDKCAISLLIYIGLPQETLTQCIKTHAYQTCEEGRKKQKTPKLYFSLIKIFF